jgi:hypothetical protein
MRPAMVHAIEPSRSPAMKFCGGSPLACAIDTD